jgi:zinc transporter ZupT
MNKETTLSVVLLTIFFCLFFSLSVMALAGWVVAWAWNSFLVPNSDIATIVWWQAALGILGVRMILGLMLPTRVTLNK